MNKFLVVVRGYNEPGNNTPADVIWVKVADYEPQEIKRVEESIAGAFETDYPNGVDVMTFPIEDIQDEWRRA